MVMQIIHYVMALRRKMETFLTELEELNGSPEGTYDHHKQFYISTREELKVTQTRIPTVSDNKIITEQLRVLSKSLDSIEQLHKMKLKKELGENCLSKEEVALLREGIRSIFIAILKLEQTKTIVSEP